MTQRKHRNEFLIECLLTNAVEGVGAAGKFQKHIDKVLAAVSQIYDPSTPSYKISLRKLSDINVNGLTILQQVAGPQEAYLEIINRVRNDLINTGYRDPSLFMTAQEHKIIGSTPFRPSWEPILREKDIKYPHRSVGLVNKQMTLPETRKARELAKFIWDPSGTSGLSFNLDFDEVYFSLESLTDDGLTVKDPLLLGPDFQPIVTTYASNFPYRRAYLGSS